MHINVNFVYDIPSYLNYACTLFLQGRMAVIIMVSGWMEEDEDDKRTFGVVPSEENLSLKVCGFRFQSPQSAPSKTVHSC